MTELSLKDFREDFPVLIEAGFIACREKDEDSAKKIFRAAQIIEPSSCAPKLGLGYIALNKLELDIAEQQFREILSQDSEHHLARAFLGITLSINPKSREKGKSLLEEAIAQSDDPQVKNLGSVSLKWLASDLEEKKK